MTSSNPARRPGARALATLALVLLAACEGGNGWRGLPTGVIGGGPDASAPQVEIQEPKIGRRIAVQDSILVEVDLRDDVGVDTVIFSGFAERGDRSLGTDTIVQRFVPKRVVLRGQPMRHDTTLTRHLLPTADSLAEQRVFVVVTAKDSVGNVRADTVPISIGGPRVQIVEPGATAEVRGGGRLRVRVVAADSTDPVDELVLRLREEDGTQILKDTTLALSPPRARVDTVVEWTIPASTPATVALEAVARTVGNDAATSSATTLRVLPGATDQRPPTVAFTTSSRGRLELSDTFRVQVQASDSSGVDSVGVTVVAVQKLPTGTLTAARRFVVAHDDSATISVPVDTFGIAQPTDTSTVELHVAAFAYDASAARNCGASHVARTPLNEPCDRRDGLEFSSGPSAQVNVLLVRGTTARASTLDRLVDLAVDSVGRRVFVSNFARNRVEILPFGDSTFRGSIRVGSEPWGLAIGVRRDTLYAANSAGTNISVVPLATLTEAQQLRIGPPDLRLWSFTYDVDSDSVNTVEPHDYSDRPQFIGQSRSGHLIYSTVPTSVREPGTIRIIDPAKDLTNEFGVGSEIFTGYASALQGQGIVVNALGVRVGGGQITVCPRRLRASQGSHPPCVTGTADSATIRLAELRAAGLTDTRIDIDADIESIALTDTTFVAVSRDLSTISFGEGGVDPGRVFLFRDEGGALDGTTRETGDLLGNAAERVTSLALNADGSLGVARGRRAYFFDQDLRLEGQAETGSSSNAGGVALHPLDAGYPGNAARRRAFVSGIADGVPYIDIIESFEFRTLRRIFIRDQVIGPLVAAAVLPGDVDADKFQIRLFGITAAGVVQVGVTAADLSGGASVRRR